MNNTSKEKDLWKMLWLDFLIALICLIAVAFGWKAATSVPLLLLAGTVPLFLIIFHAIWTLSLRRGLGFLLLAAIIGFGFETVGLSTKAVFGLYVYHMQTPALLGIPILVILYWSAFIYLGYSISNSFLHWSGRSKPNLHNRNRPLLIKLILADALIVTAIDLFMDPLQVRLGNWSWPDSGAYFGIPLQNFAGWFLVTAVVTAAFRMFEYYRPRRLAAAPQAVFLIPLLVYLGLNLFFAALALLFRMQNLIITGSLLMTFVTLLNLAWYEKRILLRAEKG